jgi:arginyl-tRNA synthetase
VITADLDAELLGALQAMAEAGELPEEAVLAPGGTWRQAPGGDPAGYATSLPFEIARLAGCPPAALAEALAARLGGAAWIQSAQPSGDGYLTIAVTPAALASVARRIVDAGPACARSEILRRTSAQVRAWPDLAAAATWQQAWQEQADAMTGRMAEAAGASIGIPSGPELAVSGRRSHPAANSPVLAAVAYFGVSAIRYQVARTVPGRADQLGRLAGARQREPDPYAAVQLAHADAASTLRWAADLGAGRAGPGDGLAAVLDGAAERALLGLLSWLPVRVASAARRHRPDEVPRYLEDVAASWGACKQASPALPFAGSPAGGDPAVVSARLLLADAVRAVLEAGLALTGITARDRI